MTAFCLGAKLLRQVHEIGRYDLKGWVRGEVRQMVWAVLQWTRNKGRLHSFFDHIGGTQVI